MTIGPKIQKNRRPNNYLPNISFIIEINVVLVFLRSFGNFFIHLVFYLFGLLAEYQVQDKIFFFVLFYFGPLVIFRSTGFLFIRSSGLSLRAQLVTKQAKSVISVSFLFLHGISNPTKKHFLGPNIKSLQLIMGIQNVLYQGLNVFVWSGSSQFFLHFCFSLLSRSSQSSQQVFLILSVQDFRLGNFSSASFRKKKSSGQR